MAWQNRRADVSEGWQWRVASKIGGGAVLGALGGPVWGILYGESAIMGMAAVSANCAFGMGTFAAFQEACRKLRRSDSWPNSFLAGAGTGILMGRAYRGPKYAFPAAVVLSGTAVLAYEADEYIVQSGALRRMLLAMDLQDPTPEEIAAWKAEKFELPWYRQFAWPKWMPVRVLDEGEMEEVNKRREWASKRKASAMEGGGKAALLQYDDELLMMQALKEVQEIRALEEAEAKAEADAKKKEGKKGGWWPF